VFPYVSTMASTVSYAICGAAYFGLIPKQYAPTLVEIAGHLQGGVTGLGMRMYAAYLSNRLAREQSGKSAAVFGSNVVNEMTGDGISTRTEYSSSGMGGVVVNNYITVNQELR